MGKRIYPLNAIKYWYSYDIDEVCSLYKKYNLHAQTIRSWINNGLATIDGGKPSLIYGNDLRIFLGKMNLANKCRTLFEEMFCLKCQEGKPPYKKQVQLEHINRYVKAKAHCQTCKIIMNKSYKLDDYSKLKSLFHVVGVLELYDCKDATAKTQIPAFDEQHPSESFQGELFPL